MTRRRGRWPSGCARKRRGGSRFPARRSQSGMLGALPAPQTAQTAAAAAALARALGVPETAIAEGIRTYPGLPHRQQEVAVVQGVRFINDSKATNADAASRAMGCYDRFIWIAGGVGKAGGIEALAPLFP